MAKSKKTILEWQHDMLSIYAQMSYINSLISKLYDDYNKLQADLDYAKGRVDQIKNNEQSKPQI